MEKQSFRLPIINLRNIAQTHSTHIKLLKPHLTSRSSLQTFLKEVKLQHISVKRRQENKREQGYKLREKTDRLFQQASRLQIKRFNQKEKLLTCEDENIIEEENVWVDVYTHDTIWKPPHRYKTALAFFEDQLILYGGIGCQKYLGLVKFSLKNQQWQTPKPQQNTQIAVYGHTMGIYKGYAYIYGGMKLDSPTNELLQINLKNPTICQLTPSPYRRRDHAMTFLNKYIMVHGGIESGNEVKSTLMYFDIDINKWSVPQQYQMPHLSHHSLISIPQKYRRRLATFQEVLADTLYIFGGKNEKEVSTNKLYRLRVRESGELTTQQIITKAAPYPRHSACAQFIQPSYICIYGGKSDSQASDINMMNGIFNDLSLFNIDSQQWVTPTLNIELPFKFGASSTSNKNKFFIFGGSEVNGYSDGNVIELFIGKEAQQSDPEETFRKGKLRG